MQRAACQSYREPSATKQQGQSGSWLPADGHAAATFAPARSNLVLFPEVRRDMCNRQVAARVLTNVADVLQLRVTAAAAAAGENTLS